jgi:hypothetical protein
VFDARMTFACLRSLLKLVTTFFNKFSKQQTVDIRKLCAAVTARSSSHLLLGNYLLTYLANNLTKAPSFLIKPLIQVGALWSADSALNRSADGCDPNHLRLLCGS